MNKKRNKKLPIFFKTILWSYNFDGIDAQKNKKTIIVNTINYGDFKHWRWLINCYGRAEIKNILQSVPATEIKPRAKKLAALIFSINHFNYALRCAHS